MSRAKWKGPYISKNLIENFLIKKNKQREKETLVMSRSSTILPNFVQHAFKIHNGKTFSKIIIKEDMIGKKFGEFSPTRKSFSFKKKKLK
jgi:small subunit ribosomal protein S19